MEAKPAEKVSKPKPMLSSLLRPGSFISQGQFPWVVGQNSPCWYSCRGLLSSQTTALLSFGLPFSSYFPSRLLVSKTVKGSNPENRGKEAAFLIELDWGQGMRSSNISLPRKISTFKRGSTVIIAVIKIVCRSNCSASKQGESVPEFIWFPGDLLLGYRQEGVSTRLWVAPGKGTPTFSCCCHCEGSQENPANTAIPDCCHWEDSDGKRWLEVLCEGASGYS